MSIERLTGVRIDDRYGVPKEMLSCPACGFMYGYQNCRACTACEECVRCCPCVEPALIPGKDMQARALRDLR